MATRELIEQAISKAGSEERLGRAIGFSQHAVWKAKKLGRVSAEMAAALHRWSDGEIPNHELRPDLYPEPVQTQPAPSEAAL